MLDVHMTNTPKQGRFRHIVFKDGDTWYAVALEFNIVESGDSPVVAYANLLESAAGYVESVRKVRGLRNYNVLNQKPDPEYEKLWTDLQSPKPIKSPYQVSSVGYSQLV